MILPTVDTAGSQLSTGRHRLDPDTGTLLGSGCAECGWISWPPRAGCPRCHSMQVDPVTLPTSGIAHTWTRVWVPIEGIAPPYDLAVVLLDEVRVFAHLLGVGDRFDTPAPVRLEIGTAEDRPRFWFVPV